MQALEMHCVDLLGQRTVTTYVAEAQWDTIVWQYVPQLRTVTIWRYSVIVRVVADVQDVRLLTNYDPNVEKVAAHHGQIVPIPDDGTIF